MFKRSGKVVHDEWQTILAPCRRVSLAKILNFSASLVGDFGNVARSSHAAK
ncbi:hypothetical protein SAMD00019534_049190 [Acytostelium subglobosum LB1]|uniref:hypothetical protein n=1 Tax=Acytostelium subglobosum LB1 TaxID=1410327 RepID=UPI000644A88B|nr:hypothetical protein SAMD00019534_049190 [Acytostelium subglobosum LB1]GAM21744.1 hypothetical protein SAMD00019534_049190 [Acytostelium subglobosum LB1]|eukprot:XP_012754844.1 hypothetical protein SAMD00019534_049190 [Acytostelium subglobosum LB1]